MEVQVTVLSLGGDETKLRCSAESSVWELKKEIEQQTGHVTTLQRLVLHGSSEVLKDKQKLADLGQETITVSLVVRGLDLTQVNTYIERLRDKGRILNEDVENIQVLCALMQQAFMKEAPLLELEAPLVICGTLVGCMDQLRHIFSTCGDPPSSKYLFLGNYVNRGKNSIDTLTLLLLYKRAYPDQVYLLRGKQETASISRLYGLFDECKRKLDRWTWKNFIEMFNCMPFAALIQGRILCVPSGLSPYLKLEQLRSIRRPCDVSDEGLLCDLLWAFFDADCRSWEEGDQSIQLSYGPDVLEQFLQQTQLERIICSARVLEEGHQSFQDKLVELFSASNYCNEFGNAGAVLLLDEKLEHRFITYRLPW